MIALPRNIRFIPIVLVAIIGLFALKTMGLLFNGGYTLGERLARRNQDRLMVVAPEEVDPSAPTQIRGVPAKRQSWAQSMFNYPDITGSIGEPKSSSEPIPLKVTEKPAPDAAAMAMAGAEKPVPAGERAILERLTARRQELDARARELDMRENLIKAAEKRLEAKVKELKDTEVRITTAVQKRDETEVARFKTLVTMYENMKAKDAARIFDRLDIKILLDVAGQINPRRMSDILAQMSPDAAERLTVELANRAGAAGGKELPKIEGKPTGN